MAKLEAWEEKVRKDAEAVADDLNSAVWIALQTHEAAREADPEGIAPPDPGQPDWIEKLVPRSRIHLKAYQASIAALRADEDEDDAAVDEAMKALADFVDGLRPNIEWLKGPDGYHVVKNLREEDEERYPFLTTSMVLGFLDHWERYQQIARLGVCRQCKRVYLKAKHGRKTRYCSSTCRQRAFRERHKE